MSDDNSNKLLDESINEGETNKTKELNELPEESESEQEVRTWLRKVTRRPGW